MVIKTMESTVKTFKHQWLQILEKCTSKVKNAVVQREEVESLQRRAKSIN